MSTNSREFRTAVISRKQTQLESRKLTVSIVVLAIVFSVDFKAVIEVILSLMSFCSSYPGMGPATPEALLRTTIDSVKGMLML